MSRVLVLGGSRSGKSAHAESLVADAGDVTYLATSPPVPGDAEWAERVAAHRARRPASWTTLETTAPSDLLRRGTVLVDSITTWVAALMDETGVWTDRPAGVGGAAHRPAGAGAGGGLDPWRAAVGTAGRPGARPPRGRGGHRRSAPGLAAHRGGAG